MSKTQYYCAASLDGYIAEADDTLEWLMKYEGSFSGDDVEPIKGSYDRYYAGVGALVMGSKTYEFILDHEGKGGKWPYEGKPTWILSSRDLPRPRGEGVDVRIVNAEVPDLYDEMIAAAGERDLWVVGGGNVASQFADAGLLDEVLVTVVPVVLGEGKPLFDRRLPGGPMQLTGTRPFDSGMVELRYETRRQHMPSANLDKENLAFVKRMYERWNRSGGVPRVELMDPEIEVEVPDGFISGTYRGHAGVSEVLESFWDYFADHHIDVEECIPAGEDVVVTVHYYGRGKASGVEVDMRHWHVWTVRDGKAVRWRVLNTREQALRAVGLAE